MLGKAERDGLRKRDLGKKSEVRGAWQGWERWAGRNGLSKRGLVISFCKMDGVQYIA